MVYSQLSQAKKRKNNNIALFENLVLVIIIENFCQFPPMIRKY